MLKQKVDLIDEIDNLTQHTSQLDAMLFIIYGEGFKSFNNFNDDVKQNYLWACAEKAEKINKIAKKIATS